MLQLHLSDQQFYCLLKCILYYRFDSSSNSSTQELNFFHCIPFLLVQFVKPRADPAQIYIPNKNFHCEKKNICLLLFSQFCNLFQQAVILSLPSVLVLVPVGVPVVSLCLVSWCSSVHHERRPWETLHLVARAGSPAINGVQDAQTLLPAAAFSRLRAWKTTIRDVLRLHAGPHVCVVGWRHWPSEHRVSSHWSAHQALFE